MKDQKSPQQQFFRGEEKSLLVSPVSSSREGEMIALENQLGIQDCSFGRLSTFFTAVYILGASIMQQPTQSQNSFKQSVQLFVRETLTLVRSSLREDTATIDSILALLSHKFKLSPTSSPSPSQDIPGGLCRIQREVQELAMENDDLSEKLFDLGQRLVQEQRVWAEGARRKVEEIWEERLGELGREWGEERLRLEGELEGWRSRCRELEKSKLGDGSEGKRKELERYLESLEDIYQEVEQLKAYSQRGNWQSVQASLDSNSREDLRSEQYFTSTAIKQDASTVMSNRPYSPRNYPPPPPKSPHNLITIKTQSVSQYRPNRYQEPVSTYHRSPSRSPRPPTSIIMHCQDHRPAAHCCSRDRQIVEEKNRRLQAVELKLQCLRRQLKRQFEHQLY